MTAQSDPYVRVYYRVLSDGKFRGLSSAAWGQWVRLLVVADGMYPAPAPLPRWTEEEPLAELVAAGIIDLEVGDHFRVHGMVSERAGRAEAATYAADVKHHGLVEANRRRELRAPASDRIPPHLRPHAPASAEPASPLLSSPIQSTPLQALPRPTFMEPKTTKKPADDEQLMAERLAEYRDPATPSWKRDVIRQWLGDMGVKDPDTFTEAA